MIQILTSSLIAVIGITIMLILDNFSLRKKVKEFKNNMSSLEDGHRIEKESKKFWHKQATQNLRMLQSLRKENEKLRLRIDADLESRNTEVANLKNRIKVLEANADMAVAIEKFEEHQKYGYGDLKTKVIEILINTTDEFSASELAEKLGTSPACVRKSLKSLMKTRDVERKKYGKTYKYRPARWISAEYF